MTCESRNLDELRADTWCHVTGCTNGAQAVLSSSDLMKTSRVQLPPTRLYSLRAPSCSLFPPLLPFQTIQVTLAHTDITTGFDS